jgi:hypothetical protein
MPQNSAITNTIQAANDTSTASSLFLNHSLAPSAAKPVIHYTQYDYFPALVLFIAFALFVLLYVYNRKRLNQIIKAFYLNRAANQLIREEASIVNRTTVVLSIIFIVSSSIFIYQLLNYYDIRLPFENTKAIWLIPTTIVGIYFIKIVSIKFFGFVFKLPTEATNYIFTLLLFTNALGLFILPVVVGISFIKQAPVHFFVYSGIGVIIVFLCTRVIRGIIIGVNSLRVSNLYLFFYLCTLEILPILILTKLFLIGIK